MGRTRIRTMPALGRETRSRAAGLQNTGIRNTVHRTLEPELLI